MDPRATILALSCLACLAAACGERARSDPSPSAPAAIASGESRTASGPSGAPAASGSPNPSAPSTSASASATAASTASGSAAPSAAPTSSARVTTGAGAGDCKLVRGPVKLSVAGAVAIGPGEGGLLAFAVNKVGAPVWEVPRFPEATKPGSTSLVPKTGAPTPLLPSPLAPSPRPAIPSTGATGTSPSALASSDAVAASSGAASGSAAPEDRTRLPACALAGGLTFCADVEGQIHRRPVQGGDDKIVAKGRRGTPVSAVALGGHTFYAFLANQKTTEGVIVRAFVAIDDETPIPLSEEGSGATSVALVARDDDVLAMYIDARTALTPVHARTLKAEGAALTRGRDAVVLVGGGSDSVVRGAVGRAASGPAFVFAPMSRDGSEYGLSVVPIGGEPKDDMDAKWSLYPAPLTSPPIAATTGATPLRLARVRPETKDEGAPSVLELGHVEPDGTFTGRCVVAKGGGFSDVSIAAGDLGDVWLAYTNSKGTWVEQRGPGGK